MYWQGVIVAGACDYHERFLNRQYRLTTHSIKGDYIAGQRKRRGWGRGGIYWHILRDGYMASL